MQCVVDDVCCISQAQEQTTPLTTADKIRERADTVYVMCDGTGNTLQGFLRLGHKHLFLYPVSVQKRQYCPRFSCPHFIHTSESRGILWHICSILPPSFCCWNTNCRQDAGEMVEQDTVCLLDFYVHESLQRRGIGFDLFNLALKVKLCEGDLRRSWA